MSFGLVEPFNLDLQGQQTIGFFPIPYGIFLHSIVKIHEELWPVEHRQTYTQNAFKTTTLCLPYRIVEVM